MGAKSDLRAAARCPGVANPRRSPNPKDFLKPSTAGWGRIMGKISDRMDGNYRNKIGCGRFGSLPQTGIEVVSIRWSSAAVANHETAHRTRRIATVYTSSLFLASKPKAPCGVGSVTG